MTISRDALAEHLKLFEELGVTGYSKDPAWGVRPESGESQESRESKESGRVGGVGRVPKRFQQLR